MNIFIGISANVGQISVSPKTALKLIFVDLVTSRGNNYSVILMYFTKISSTS